MGGSQKWPDLRSPISKFRDIHFVGTDTLTNFDKFQTCRIKTVGAVRSQSFFEVRSLNVTSWPDLTWPEVQTHTKCAQWMSGQVCKIWRRCTPPFSGELEKTLGWGRKNASPLGRRGLILYSSFIKKVFLPTWINTETDWGELGQCGENWDIMSHFSPDRHFQYTNTRYYYMPRTTFR